MGTKQTTTTTNQFSPAGMSTYNALQGPMSSLLNSNISSPYNNTGFNTRMAQGTAANRGFGASAGASTRQANSALGTTGGTAFNNYQTASQGRANAANQGQMSNNLILGAAQNRNQSLSAAMNYRPLQTGGTQVQQTSGLGTWLPQVIGAGISAAGTAFGMPGLGKAFGGTPFSSGAGQQGFNQWAGSGFGGAPIMNPDGGPFQSAPTAPDDVYGTSGSGFGAFGSSPYGSF